jgi:phenylacetate-CoA ligase
LRKLNERLYFWRNKLDRRQVTERLRFYEQTQYWPRTRLEELQVTMFNRLWKHAVGQVPYYRNLAGKKGALPESIRSLEELRAIPMLTKEIIRENLDHLTAGNLPRERFVKNSTSGYSGSNLHFYTDSSSIVTSTALTMRRYHWMDGSIFDREMAIWGASWDLPGETLFTRLKKGLNIENTINVSGYRLSDDDIFRIHEKMKRTSPAIIKSYPSILYKICAVFDRHGLSYRPAAIHIGGEKLYDFQRERIEATFQTRVYDFYGARDMPSVAQNCNRFEGLHVFMENVIVEVLDEQGEPVQEGEGDLVITDLHNDVMPFIRYRIGDRARVSASRQCSCGRSLQLLDEVLGRSFDILEFPNGNRVGGSFWTLVARSLPGIRDFQVVQEAVDSIVFKYVLERGFENIDIKLLKERILNYSGEALRITFEKVSEIPVSDAGKSRFVISRILP